MQYVHTISVQASRKNFKWIMYRIFNSIYKCTRAPRLPRLYIYIQEALASSNFSISAVGALSLSLPRQRYCVLRACSLSSLIHLSGRLTRAPRRAFLFFLRDVSEWDSIFSAQGGLSVSNQLSSAPYLPLKISIFLRTRATGNIYQYLSLRITIRHFFFIIIYILLIFGRKKREF